MINYVLVNKTDDVSSIPNGTFVYCKELVAGFMKKDLSPLNLTSTTFEAVIDGMDAVPYNVLADNGLDAIVFGGNDSDLKGQMVISHKVQQNVEETIVTLSTSTEKTNFLDLKRLFRRYFDYAIISEDDTLILLSEYISGNAYRDNTPMRNINYLTFDVKFNPEGSFIIGDTIVNGVVGASLYTTENGGGTIYSAVQGNKGAVYTFANDYDFETRPFVNITQQIVNNPDGLDYLYQLLYNGQVVGSTNVTYPWFEDTDLGLVIGGFSSKLTDAIDYQAHADLEISNVKIKTIN